MQTSIATKAASSCKVIQNWFGRLTHRRQRTELALIGPYNTYEEASLHSSGYNNKVILDKVYQAVCEVLEGNYVYERDGTSFARRPSIDNLRHVLVAHLKDDDFVVDFGGGLGGAFVNNRDLFSGSNFYTVVEQSIFVKAGRELALKYRLHVQFVDSICNLLYKPDIVILSSVLQYIPEAEYILKKAAELMPRLILIDRTALAPDLNSEKWWIQNEPSYYHISISYPIRPLSLETILNCLNQYSVVDKWTNPFDPNIPPHVGVLLCRCA